jgi:hypothetical protein
MNKKSLERKAAQKYIIESRDNGKSDQEIYNNLSEHYYEKKSIATLILETVTSENKKKYKTYNNVLMGLLLLTILFRLYMVFSLTIQSGELWILLFALFVPILAGYFIYEISNYQKHIYRICGIMTALSFWQNMRKLDNTADVLTNVIFTFAIFALSFYLDNKMFPNFNAKNLKKDSNGEYILPNSEIDERDS